MFSIQFTANYCNKVLVMILNLNIIVKFCNNQQLNRVNLWYITFYRHYTVLPSLEYLKMYVCWKTRSIVPKIDNIESFKETSYQLITSNEKIAKNPKHIAILDLETSNLIVSGVQNESMIDIIPTILQLGIVVYTFEEFMNTEDTSRLLDLGRVYNFMTPSMDEVVAQLKNIYEKFDDIIFIAHNGNSFDFKIIISYLVFNECPLRFRSSWCNNLRFSDSMMEIKRIDKEKQYNRVNYKNITLFSHYLNKYQNCGNLVKNIHDAVTDCKITSAWIHALKNEFDFKNCMNTKSLIEKYTHQNNISYKKYLKCKNIETIGVVSRQAIEEKIKMLREKYKFIK